MFGAAFFGGAYFGPTYWGGAGSGEVVLARFNGEVAWIDAEILTTEEGVDMIEVEVGA